MREVKESREMGARYMTFQELLNDEREEGLQEGRFLKLKEQVEKKLAKGCSIEDIADMLEEDIEVIKDIVAELQEEQ